MSGKKVRGLVCGKIYEKVEEAIEDLKVGTFERKELASGEVRVSVHAGALNFFDLLILQGKYQIKFTPPFVPGEEGAGVVTETGCKN